jgi:hypothetical protein
MKQFHILFAPFDPDRGPSITDRMEAREEARRRAEEKRERKLREEEERVRAREHEENARRQLEEHRLNTAMAATEIFACQQALSVLVTSLPDYLVPDPAVYVASNIAQVAEKAGKDYLKITAQRIHQIQSASENKLQNSMNYVCRHEVGIRNAIDAAAREKEIRANYNERINKIALDGIIDNSLLLINNPIADKLIAAAEIGLAPDITYKDIAETLIKAATGIAGIALTPFLAPIKMGSEYIILNRALERIKEHAEEQKREELRREAEKLQNDIRDSFDHSRDYKWNRDPGWIDFIGRHGNIA